MTSPEPQFKEHSELVFLGTGTSGGVPDLACLVDPAKKCQTCWSSLEPGSKDRRFNTSILIRTTYEPIVASDEAPSKRPRNIVIDCGKYFWPSALKSFPALGISHLDAVILTHGHADAYLGLDDLRDFSNIREGGVPLAVYLREEDVPEIRRAYPYLMNKGKTENGMHVPALEFIIYDPHKPFDVFGVTFTPLQVNHGPGVMCSAFVFGKIIYISDVDEIPQTVVDWILASFRPYNDHDGNLVLHNPHLPILEYLILDALWPEVHYKSHMSLSDAINEFKRFRPRKGYTIGMSHEIPHDKYSKILKQKSAELHLDIELSWDGLSFPIEL